MSTVLRSWRSFISADGYRSFSIQSSSQRTRWYRVTDNGCSCPDAIYHPWRVCKHVQQVHELLDSELCGSTTTRNRVCAAPRGHAGAHDWVVKTERES
jgi:hypothetical protein